MDVFRAWNLNDDIPGHGRNLYHLIGRIVQRNTCTIPFGIDQRDVAARSCARGGRHIIPGSSQKRLRLGGAVVEPPVPEIDVNQDGAGRAGGRRGDDNGKECRSCEAFHFGSPFPVDRERRGLCVHDRSHAEIKVVSPERFADAVA